MTLPFAFFARPWHGCTLLASLSAFVSKHAAGRFHCQLLPLHMQLLLIALGNYRITKLCYRNLPSFPICFLGVRRLIS
jgi:hypothetical protein